MTIISGDCCLPGLGISPEERELLKDQTNIVIHGAATVRFDEKLKIAIAINVNGTKEMLLLAKEILHLKVTKGEGWKSSPSVILFSFIFYYFVFMFIVIK